MPSLASFVRRALRYSRSQAHRCLRPRTQRCTLRLPPEIVDIILEHLPPESVDAFSLACRVFYWKYTPRPPRLPQPAKETLLSWLEQEAPKHCFCHPCETLHIWRKSHYMGIDDYNSACKLRHKVESAYHPPGCIHLPYHAARLVMNRHLYGRSHGPPLKEIELDPGPPPWRYNYKIVHLQSWQVRIMDDELYLHAESTIYHARRDSERLREYLRSTYKMVCYHCYHLQVGQPFSCRTTPGHAIIPELSRIQDPGESFSVISGLV